jgi:hypothetical protein
MIIQEVDYLKKIRRLAIVALFSDVDLMNLLVLKGGNLLDIVYGISFRSSIDIDFSIEGEFKKRDLSKIKRKIEILFRKTFKDAGYEVFDINFIEIPRKILPAIKDFWGGYHIEFKLIEIDKYSKHIDSTSALRRNAIVIGPNQQKKFEIEISKHEYCSQKEKKELDGLTVYSYSPLMIIFEKLRAICQQMPKYRKIVKTHHPTARARDFVDIYVVFESFKINWLSDESKELMINIFNAKRVPLSYLGKIRDYKEFHRQDFDAVKAGINLKEFDYYFEYVVSKCNQLKSFGII